MHKTIILSSRDRVSGTAGSCSLLLDEGFLSPQIVRVSVKWLHIAPTSDVVFWSRGLKVIVNGITYPHTFSKRAVPLLVTDNREFQAAAGEDNSLNRIFTDQFDRDVIVNSSILHVEIQDEATSQVVPCGEWTMELHIREIKI